MSNHVHCDADPIECSVQAMEGEWQATRERLHAALARLAELENASREVPHGGPLFLNPMGLAAAAQAWHRVIQMDEDFPSDYAVAEAVVRAYLEATRFEEASHDRV